MRTRREFPAKVKLAAWRRCRGICEGENCGAKLTPGKFVYDHATPDQLGGGPTLDNCQVLCSACNKPKTAKDAGDIAKAKRLELRRLGIKKPRTMRVWRKFNSELVFAPRER